MKFLLASLFALVLLGAPRPALAWEPNDMVRTMVLCSTSASVMTVLTAAEMSGEEATTEMRNFITAGVCWLTDGWPVTLLKRLHTTIDYEGDLVEMWSVEDVELPDRVFFIWLISPQA